MKPLSISIITPVRNGAGTIAECVGSIGRQSCRAEHIVVDGASTDQTVSLVRQLAPGARLISEPDRGIYDAMNKGIRLAGGDIVGILNADDYYCHDQVLERVVQVFQTQQVDALFADLVFVRPGNLDKVVRYYRGADFTPERFAFGCMPPHPTFFVRRSCYERYGLFKTNYRIAADFELLARLLYRHRVSYHYLPEVIIKMRTGGASTRSFKSNIILNREILRACADNGIETNMVKVYSKYFTKCLQLVSRPS